jgi:hypothetical protein
LSMTLSFITLLNLLSFMYVQLQGLAIVMAIPTETGLKRFDQPYKWLISKRYISSDSGIPVRFDQTYEPRGNPLADWE